jgi:hypothetical protein
MVLTGWMHRKRKKTGMPFKIILTGRKKIKKKIKTFT